MLELGSNTTLKIEELHWVGEQENICSFTCQPKYGKAMFLFVSPIHYVSEDPAMKNFRFNRRLVVLALLLMVAFTACTTQSNQPEQTVMPPTPTPFPAYSFMQDASTKAHIDPGITYIPFGKAVLTLNPGDVYDFTVEKPDGSIHIAIYAVNSQVSGVEMHIPVDPTVIHQTHYSGDQFAAIDLRLREIAHDLGVQGLFKSAPIAVYINNSLQGRYTLYAQGVTQGA